MHMARRRKIVTVFAACFVLLFTGCANFSASAGLAPCVVTPAAKLVPASGVLFGVKLDWGSETLAKYSAQLGKRPSVAVSFTNIPFTSADRVNVLPAADQVRANGGDLLLTLEPQQGLAEVTPAVVSDLIGVRRRRGVQTPSQSPVSSLPS